MIIAEMVLELNTDCVRRAKFTQQLRRCMKFRPNSLPAPQFELKRRTIPDPHRMTPA
jgi:hypothetical protein